MSEVSQLRKGMLLFRIALKKQQQQDFQALNG